LIRSYVSVGSNIDKARNVRSAVRALRQRYGTLMLSPVYECPAVGFEGDDFYNMVVGFDTLESAESVVAGLRAIEVAHGRKRGAQRFTSRTLDLDLLTYGEAVIDRPGLRLPRAEITRYAFVLKPLVDLAGEETHPELGRSYRVLWESFDAARQPLRLVELDFE